jgi:hypothetical protein
VPASIPPSDRLRSLTALVCAAALVAAGCTGTPGDDAAKPPSAEPSSTAELVEAAIGSGVDTQDFQLLVDIAAVG